MKTAGRLFALSNGQLADVAEGKVRLNARQVEVLRRQGLVTPAERWHYAPNGAFALAPGSPDAPREQGHRQRINLQLVTTVRDEAA